MVSRGTFDCLDAISMSSVLESFGDIFPLWWPLSSVRRLIDLPMSTSQGLLRQWVLLLPRQHRMIMRQTSRPTPYYWRKRGGGVNSPEDFDVELWVFCY